MMYVLIEINVKPCNQYRKILTLMMLLFSLSQHEITQEKLFFPKLAA